MDNLKDTSIWKNKVVSKEYDYNYIQNLRDNLRAARLKHDIQELIHLIRAHPFRNVANILNPDLYRECYIGTKKLIEDYQ